MNVFSKRMFSDQAFLRCLKNGGIKKTTQNPEQDVQ